MSKNQFENTKYNYNNNKMNYKFKLIKQIEKKIE